MPRSRTRHPARAAAALALALALLPAARCVEVIPGGRGADTALAGDTLAGVPADLAPPAVAIPDSLAPDVAPDDSLVRDLVTAPLPASPAPPAPRASRARRDTTPIVATPAELAALRAAMVVPVQGVAPSALRDTYTESRGRRSHDAIDILAPRGTPVLSATAGRVLKIHESVPGGLMVYATDAAERFILLYGHLERVAPELREGMPLRAGQPIGEVGTSGNAPPGTPHLHFAVLRGDPGAAWWRGTAVNPYPLLAR